MSVDVAAIREALTESEPAPWTAKDGGIRGPNEWIVADVWPADAELIVLLRNSIEALLDRLEDAERERDQAQERISELTSITSPAFADRLREELRAREMVQDPEGYFARARAEYAKTKMPSTKQEVLDLLAKVKGRRA